MSQIADLLADINQSLTDMVAAWEKNSTGTELASIEQALSDVAAAMEQRKHEPVNLQAIVDAIKGLKLAVTVSPTPVHVHPPEIRPVFQVPETQVHVVPDAFKPLVVTIKRDRRTSLIESLEIQVKE